MARKKITLCQSVDDLMQTYFPKLSKEQKASEREADEQISKRANQEKASIKLRGKKASKSVTPYFDQYKDSKRTYEYFPEYALNIESSEQTRLDNITKLEAIKIIYKERKDKLLLKGIGISKATKSNIILIDYIKTLADEQLKETGNKYSYYYVLKSLIKHIEIFDGNKTTINEIDINWVKRFLSYIKNDALNFNYKRTGDKERDEDKQLSSSHQHQLWAKLNWVLNHCVYDEKIKNNPCSAIPSKEIPREQKGTREYLNIEEIKALYKTDCKQPQLKQAFLFCCLTGLRFSDIKQLKWKHLKRDISGDMMIEKVMQKLSHIDREEVNTLKTYISDEALKWLPGRGAAQDNDLIFSLSDNEQTNIWLKKWCKDAEITKKVTFHCSRHSSAMLNLNLGVPIEKVAKMMGHTKISTTQIYAKMLAEQTKDAVSKQNGIFD